MTYALRVQVGLVYFFAGLAKLSTDWLLHAQPLNIWLQSRAELPVLGVLFQHWSAALVMSWTGFIFDISIVAWLSWRRARPYAYVVLLAFHLLTHLLFNIGMFPLIMSACALVFFEPDWPRRLWRWLRPNSVDEAQTSEGSVVETVASSTAVRTAEAAGDHESLAQGAELGWTTLRLAGFGLLGAYLLLQVIMPLRHFAYPGDVLWNEQGMRWAWKVKVRAKNGAVSYFVTLPNGRRQIVTPRRYLTDYQEREMSGQPDLILQLGRHIGAEYAHANGPVEVRVDARVSLNGRPSAPLIDPSIDLMKVNDSVTAFAWVRPAPTTEPPHLNRTASPGSPQ